MPKILCLGGTHDEQVALRERLGSDFEVVSGGVDPRGVHPLTIRAMAEIGIDIGAARSKSISEFLDQPFDYVITVCDRARESCPVFPGATNALHWGLDDPAEAVGSEEQRLIVFRRVMVEIAGRVKAFLLQARRARGETAAVAARGPEA